MLILISTNILDKVLDLIKKERFHQAIGFGGNSIIFGVDMSSSVHVDNKKNNILILGEGPTQGLDGTTLTAGKLYPINFTANDKKFF